MGRFRKKPVEIEALQWDGSENSAVGIIAWAASHDAKIEVIYSIFPPKTAMLSIPTLEGTMSATENDWIIKGVKGEFYPCKPDIFEATYELLAPDGVDGPPVEEPSA